MVLPTALFVSGAAALAWGKFCRSIVPDVIDKATGCPPPCAAISAEPSSQGAIATLSNRATSKRPSGFSSTLPLAVRPAPDRSRRVTSGAEPRRTSASNLPDSFVGFSQPSSGSASFIPTRSERNCKNGALPLGRSSVTSACAAPASMLCGKPSANSATAACDRVTLPVTWAGGTGRGAGTMKTPVGTPSCSACSCGVRPFSGRFCTKLPSNGTWPIKPLPEIVTAFGVTATVSNGDVRRCPLIKTSEAKSVTLAVT